MSELLPKLLVAGLGAAVSPVAVMVLISLMLRKRPVRNASLFLLGFTLVLVGMGVAALLLLHLGIHHKKSTADGYVDVALGALCLLLIPVAWKRKRKAERSDAKELEAWEAFTAGGATMLVNSSTIVIYLAGVHLIGDARLALVDDLISLTVLTIVTISTLIIPIALYIVFPKTAEQALSATRVWLSKNQKYVSMAILLIFGIYLLVKGIRIVI